MTWLFLKFKSYIAHYEQSKTAFFSRQNMLRDDFAIFLSQMNIKESWWLFILGYPGVIPLATSTPGTISCISFDVPLNEYYHFIGCIILF